LYSGIAVPCPVFRFRKLKIQNKLQCHYSRYTTPVRLILEFSKSYINSSIDKFLIASLSYKGWILLNSFMVRYIARKDNRLEALK
jgi:hypothetical protein